MGATFNDGALVFVGGVLAMSTDCCPECLPPEEESCLGCTNGEDIPSLTIDVDAAGATGSHPDAFLSGCSDADCQDLTGAYVADFELPLPDVEGTFEPCETWLKPYCWWSLSLSEANSIPCESSTFGDVYYQVINVVVGKHESSSEWFIAVYIVLLDALVTPSGYQSIWLKSLGTTKPDCLTAVFPVTFTDADFCYPIEAEEGGFPITCDLHDGIEIVVDIT